MMNIVIIIYDDLTILLLWNTIKNNSNPSTPKSVTTAYEFGTWDPYSRWSTWSSSYMMTWPYFCDETPSKTTVTNQRRKVSPLRMNLAHGVPIADDEHSDHHLWWPDHTFVMKHHQNYSNQSLSKSVTTAPRFGTWGPIADAITVTSLTLAITVTPHSPTIVTTHSPTIVTTYTSHKNTKSPSLASLASGTNKTVKTVF